MSDQASNVLLDSKVRKALAAKNLESPGNFDCAVYFADDDSNSYQVRQWFGPLARLSEQFPVALLAHRPATAASLVQDSPIPVFLTRGIAQVEDFLRTRRVRVIFYVNNNQANFTVLRQTDPIHIHLNHGESDKVSMASNQLKAYDYAFIAGPASRQRILSRVKRLDENKLVEVGRPQLDSSTQGRPSGGKNLTTVLYAPTWEGDSPEMAYGSVVSHGVELTKTLLSASQYRLIFRPHPRTGTVSPEHRRALKKITALIREAAHKDPEAGHYRDERRDFSPAMDEADFCICDISAIAMDWLPRLKPLIVTQPVEPRAAINPNGIANVVPLLSSQDTPQITGIIEDLLSRPISARQKALVEHHFGDATAGASTERFVNAVQELLN